MKTHIKVNDKAICGQKRVKNKLKFADTDGSATCLRCRNAAAK